MVSSPRCCVCGTTRRALLRYRPKGSAESFWLCGPHVPSGTEQTATLRALQKNPFPVLSVPDKPGSVG